MLKSFVTSLRVLLFSAVGVVLLALCYPPSTTLATSSYHHGQTSVSMPDAAVNLQVSGGGNQGPVGTSIQVSGSGFQPSIQVNLYTTTDPNQCTPGNGNLTPFATQPAVPTQADGSFTANTTWPNSANQPGTAYYICAISPANNAAAASGSPFTIAPQGTVQVSPATATPGATITVTGANWTPPQTLAVGITTAQDANPIVAQGVNSAADGTFTVNLAIPANAQPGSYGILVASTSNPALKTFTANALTISVPTTPSPTPTVTPTPTPTPTVTPTPTPTPGGGNTPGSGSTPWMMVLIFALGGLGIILVTIGLTMFLSYSQGS